ncbi:MAG: 50S ribosomal protein L18, partial [Holophagales bacterium]|nr:50S ribosomal protein L18 [Holophagales bacterium]
MSDLRRKRTLDRGRRRQRARYRVRKKLRGSQERPRLAVHKSRRHIYAQLIDDRSGYTLAFASSLESDLQGALEGSTGSCKAAQAVGQALAESAR